MGVSLALVFHVASAIVALGLAAWGLRLQRDLRFLRAMIAIAHKGDSAPAQSGRVADDPARFVARLARAFGIPVTGAAPRTGVTAIVPAPIVQLFSRQPVSLIQFIDSRTIEIHLDQPSQPDLSLAESLTRSFGGSVRFQLKKTGDAHVP